MSTRAVTKSDFERAVDILECRAVAASLQTNQPVLDEFSKRFNCDGEFVAAEITSFLQKKPGFEKTVTLASEIDSAKSKYNPEWSRKDVLLFLTDGIYENNLFPALRQFKSKRTNTGEFDKFVGLLSTALESQLPPSTSQSPPLLTGSEVQVPETQSAANLWIPVLVTELIVAVAILGIGYAFYRRGLSPTITSLGAQIKYLGSKTSSGTAPRIQINSTSLDEGLRTHLDRLEKRIQRIEMALDRAPITYKTPARLFDSERFEERTTSFEPRKEVFYFSTPNSDGTFDVRAAQKDFRESASIYRFTQTSPNTAEFEIADNESAMKLALLYPDKNIEPVCEPQNAFDRGARRINTVPSGNGRAELIGDKWHVRTKAKIFYGH